METLAELARSVDWLELSGLVSGLACVWLLVRQNVWTFPVGLIYALASVAVMAQARLYADVLLHGYYVLMNAYGWYYWLNRGERDVQNELLISHVPARAALWLGVLVAVATAAMGWWLDNHTDADLAYWDSAITTMSFAAMWMTARKYLENWIVWLAVDVIATVVYFYKGLLPYTVLYGVYLLMAWWGWTEWRKAMRPAIASA